ncbi:MAG: SH3 domain-containing protein, partial [Aquificaceae bacterium]
MVFLFCILVILNSSYALNVSQINQQAYALIKYMKRIEDFPQVLDGIELREWIREDKLPEGRLFIENREFKEEDLSKLIENANLEGIEGKVFVRFGWTLKRTNMRMYPSMVSIHKGNPKIDYNQYTLLEPFTPLAILHTSKDGQWLYVQAPYMRGWIKKQDVLISTREELLNILQ